MKPTHTSIGESLNLVSSNVPVTQMAIRYSIARDQKCRDTVYFRRARLHAVRSLLLGSSNKAVLRRSSRRNRSSDLRRIRRCVLG